MGAQMAGGTDGLKTWIGYQDPYLIQVDFHACMHAGRIRTNRQTLRLRTLQS
jgi:hypothetical protein